jgi:hypothetical protein
VQQKKVKNTGIFKSSRVLCIENQLSHSCSKQKQLRREGAYPRVISRASCCLHDALASTRSILELNRRAKKNIIILNISRKFLMVF